MLSINSSITLANGLPMPLFGLGVWRVGDEETCAVVKTALEAGYRLIDTAAYYQNEAAVGRGLKESGLARKEVFITSKVWNDSQGFDGTLRACRESLKLLALDYLDLYLIHWPVQGPELAAETWRAMEKIYQDGLAKSIGVSNFSIAQLKDLAAGAKTKPMINQVQLHPLMAQTELGDYCRREGLAVEAYAPLARGRCFDDPLIKALAAKHHKSPAQIILRWQLQNNIVVIPKSIHPRRIRENADLYDFNLSGEEMTSVTALNRDQSVLSTVFPKNDAGYVII